MMATMILIANLAVLMMLPLLTIADPYCTNLVRQCNKNFINKCAHQNFIIQTCCDLQIFSSPTGVYTIGKEQFDTASVYTVIWTMMMDLQDYQILFHSYPNSG